MTPMQGLATGDSGKLQDEVLRDDGSESVSELSRDFDNRDRISHDHERGDQLYPLELARTVSNALTTVTTRMTNRHVVDPGPAPDGGVKAWTQVAMAWLVIVTSWGFLNSFGVFQTYYTSELGEAQSTISWVGSVQLWVLFALSAFSGRALDAGLFIPTFILGSVIQLTGVFMTSLCTTFWQLILAQGVCTGLGSGILFCPTLGLVTTYFTKKRGIAVAIVTTGNSFGGAIYPVMVRQLLPQIGFPWTVRVIGFVNLACLAMGLAFMRPRLPPRKSGPLVEWEAFTEIPFLSAIAGFSLVFGGLFFSYYYIASYGFDILGMSYGDSAYLVIVFNVIGIPARLLTGMAADRFTGPLNAIIPMIFLNAVFAFTWIAVTSVGGLTGPPIGGALLTTNGGGRGGYMSALLGVGIATMLGTALLCVARVYKAGWKLNTKC
ncbi:hypothetical protein LTR37_004147 [Vermiconidia calcicola]|uniref:Uncharacterized protein n=1 Tax=Vermiconidia calcicola TaxID=1690605 RepID=A0ACC3NN74_9PEZI|nr:hypothetical protein LTR37_004147 [Vermiconidia calcicola]